MFYTINERFYKVILLLALLVPITTYATQGQIAVRGKSLTLKQVISQIEKNSAYIFFYKEADLSRTDKQDINCEGSIEEILETILKKNDIQYVINGNEVILKSSDAAKTVPANAVLQQVKNVTIKGVIKDEAGETIIGASIIEKENPNNGTVSDIDGKYTLTVSPKAKLIISYIGYIQQTITLKSGVSQYDCILKEDAHALSEVVVVGYGTQKKVNLTGSVASVNTEDIKDRVQTNVLSAVQGTVPGVTIISRPGADPSINFRGRGNLGTSAPLYVIDGAIADASFFANLDANSIESISFLKDAASSAIYGSRAAYGVVLVTTKQGKQNKMSVSYSGYVGFTNPTYTPDYVSSTQYAELYNEALYNSNPSNGKNQGYTEEEIGWFRDGSKPDLYPNTNWEDLILKKNVATTQHSVNFSGGSEKIQYFVGLGYVYRDNIIPNRNNQRYNLNTNISSNITNWLTIRTGVKYIHNVSDVTGGTPSLPNFAIVPSTFVARQTNGEWGSMNGGQPASTVFMTYNPLRQLSKKDWSNSKTSNTMYDLGFDIKPLKGLVISGQGVFKGYEYKYKAYTALQDDIKNYQTGEAISGTGVVKNQMSMDWRSTTHMLYTATAKYDWTKDIHTIGALIGTSYEHYKYERLAGSREAFPTDGMTDMEGGSTSGPGYTNGAGSAENKMLSYFARINYSLMDRYLLEVNIRTDASSRFHQDKRWGYFPSFSLGWRLSEEAFMKRFSWIDNLKVRASYGTLGNINNVGDYDYFQNYTTNGNYNFNGEPVKGISESKPANTTLGWERVELTDIGLDLDIFNGLFSVTADYYIKNTNDILLGYSVPWETGIGTVPSQNIGKVRNKGFEMAITHRKKINDFSYIIAANIATNSNEIIDMSTSNNKITDKWILREGESIGSFFGYKTDGLYTQEDIDAGRYYKMSGIVPNAGDIKFLPIREGVEYKENITADDRTIIGNDVPDFTYGLNLNLQYKNFEFSVFGQGVIGTKVAFESYGLHPFFHGMDNPRAFHMNRWTEANPNPYADYPRIYSSSSPHTTYNRNFNDQHLFDADYFRIKTLTLGYAIPAHVIKSWGLSAFKVFVTGENLFTLRADKRMNDFDPETSGNVITTLGTKSVALGVNLTF